MSFLFSNRCHLAWRETGPEYLRRTGQTLVILGLVYLCRMHLVHGSCHCVCHRRSREWLAPAPHSLNMFSCLILAVATAVLNALYRLKPEPPSLTPSLISSKPRCLLRRQRRTHSLKEIESPFSQENQLSHSVQMPMGWPEWMLSSK